MATKKKLLQAAAGSAGGAGLDVDEVFSTFLYEGNGGNQTFTNNIDLSGEGGLVWIKSRDATSDHSLVDTARGVGARISSNSSSAQDTYSGYLSAFNSNGFNIGYSVGTNNNGDDYVSWTFRKAPKFFDVVTYTGNGGSYGTTQSVAHNLGSVPGMIIVKRTDSTTNWAVYHRGADATAPETKYLFLNTTDAVADNDAYWFDTAPTSTHFTVHDNAAVNANGASYVAYLFAHNDGDGDFGPDADQDIIKCGSFTASSSKTASINLGFEPQWLMIKSSSVAEEWIILDNMRALVLNASDHALFANATTAEETGKNYVNLTPTGFDIEDNVTGSADYIYIAIRRGPLAVPESATNVFTPVLGDGSGAPSIKTSNHVTDFGINFNKTGGGSVVGTRLLGKKQLQTHSNNAQSTNTYLEYDFMNGWHTWTGINTNYINWNWKRAPSYFDVCCYSGTTTSPSFPPQTLNHNLGAVPEMMWVKCRSSGGSSTYDWQVYHKDVGNTKALFLNTSGMPSTGTAYWNNTTPTATQFTVGGGYGVNQSGQTYVAYLFASVAGISKVGSFTGTAATQTIDCGFSSGARFVLIKETNTTGGWMVFDTVRGIVSGNDARLEIDDTGAESTASDILDPHSSGFQLPSSSFVNASGRECIFYAIA